VWKSTRKKTAEPTGPPTKILELKGERNEKVNPGTSKKKRKERDIRPGFQERGGDEKQVTKRKKRPAPWGVLEISGGQGVEGVGGEANIGGKKKKLTEVKKRYGNFLEKKKGGRT